MVIHRTRVHRVNSQGLGTGSELNWLIAIRVFIARYSWIFSAQTFFKLIIFTFVPSVNKIHHSIGQWEASVWPRWPIRGRHTALSTLIPMHHPGYNGHFRFPAVTMSHTWTLVTIHQWSGITQSTPDMNIFRDFKIIFPFDFWSGGCSVQSFNLTPDVMTYKHCVGGCRW